MAFPILGSLASLLTIVSAGTHPNTHGHCSLPWLCGSGGVGSPPTLVPTDLCLPSSVPGFCTLGAVMQPMPPNSQNPAQSWTPGAFGDGNFTLYDASCNLVGDYPNLMQASDYKNPLDAFFSQLPYSMDVTTFHPPNGYGSNVKLQFSYANFTSEVYDGVTQGTGCICTGTPSDTLAQWQQCRCPFPCDDETLALPGSDLWSSIHDVLYPS